MNGRRGRCEHKLFVFMLALAMLCALSPPVSSQTVAFSAIGGSPFIVAGPVTFAFPTMARTSTITDFHQAELSAFDHEDFSMNFPPFTDDLVLGPAIADDTMAIDGADGIKTANVLPFGQVDLGLPSLHQKCEAGMFATRTAFHKA